MTLTLTAAARVLHARTVDYPAAWECRAVVTERRALEAARDARTGNLSAAPVLARFDAASHALTIAEAEHVAATGCTDRH